MPLLNKNNFAFVFVYSIVWHASTKLRTPLPRGMASQHLRTFERVLVNKELLTGTRVNNLFHIIYIKHLKLIIRNQLGWSGADGQPFMFPNYLNRTVSPFKLETWIRHVLNKFETKFDALSLDKSTFECSIYSNSIVFCAKVIIVNRDF